MVQILFHCRLFFFLQITKETIPSILDKTGINVIDITEEVSDTVFKKSSIILNATVSNKFDCEVHNKIASGFADVKESIRLLVRPPGRD